MWDPNSEAPLNASSCQLMRAIYDYVPNRCKPSLRGAPTDMACKVTTFDPIGLFQRKLDHEKEEISLQRSP
jgi:hypothetical protein